MSTSEHVFWLAVPPEERDKARAAAGRLEDGRAGVVWNNDLKLWYARPGCDLERVREWWPDHSRRSTGGDPESDFLDALTAAGLVLNGLPVMNGQKQRVATIEDKKGKKSGVYRGFLDRRPGGWFINYHRAADQKDVTNWSATGGEADPSSRLHIRAAAQQSKDDAAREQAAEYAVHRAVAERLFGKFSAADPAHGYLARKGITPTPELKQTNNGALAVPFFNVKGEFQTLQYIPATGDKYLYKGAPKQEHFLPVGGELKNGAPILYAEGYATARSVNLAIGLPVVMTIDAGNMVAVARVLKAHYPDSPHLFLSDFDHAKDVNKGLIMATSAAQEVGGQVLYPQFNEAELGDGFTDFNDLHLSRGLDAVAAQIGPSLKLLREEHASMDKPQYPASSVSLDAELDPAGVTATNEPSAPAAPDGLAVPAAQVATSSESPSPQTVPAAPAAPKKPRTARAPAKPGQPAAAAEDSAAPAAQLAASSGSPSLEAAPATPAEPTVAPVVPAAAATPAQGGEPVSTPVTAAQAIESSQSAKPADPAMAPDSGTDPAAVRGPGADQPIDPSVAEAQEVDSAMTQADGQDSHAVASSPVPAEVVAENVNDAPHAEPVLEAPQADVSIPVNGTAKSQLDLVDDPVIDAGPVAPLPVAQQPTAVVDEAVGAPVETVAGSAPVDNPADAPVKPAGEQPDASAAVDSIWVGPPRPRGDEPPELQQIDKDALLARLIWEKQDDNTYLYKLDNEPAFIDRGMRLEMVDGASQSDEKVLAALLTAAQFYRGRIELTGSDDFQRKAIGLIAQHQLNVSMKNPAQQAALENARKSLQTAAAPKDSIRGDSPPLTGAQPEVMPTPAPVAQASAAPTPSGVPPSSASTPSEPTVVAQPDNDAAIKAQKAIHTTHLDAKNGVKGKVVNFGDAPFRFDDKNTLSTFITLRTKQGMQTFWGKELAGLLRDTRIQKGNVATLMWLGKQAVTVNVPVKDENDQIVRYEPKSAHRNQWSLQPLGQPTVATGNDVGVKLSAYDVGRFSAVQHELMARMRLDVPLPERPIDGLFWMTPDGEGSAKSGDHLTAPRPAADVKAAGQPVMSSWTTDGHLDMALVRGDGPYLQGVVRHQGQLQHVLVSLPDRENAPSMVFNLVTPTGLAPIGVGHGINKSGGVAVSRENIAFKLDGDTATRIGKLERPAEVPPALHARLGFDERWRDDNTLPKSAPAAAPTAQPSEPRPA